MYRNVQFDFKGKNFFIVGASSGIGHKVAEELAQANALICVVARRCELLNQLQNSYGERIVSKCIDVCDYEAIRVGISEFVSQHGKLDGIVYAAGVSSISPVCNIDLDYEKSVFDVNYWGAVNVIKYGLKKAYSNSGASVVLISSISAYRGTRGLATYSASKAALQSLARCCAAEYAGRGCRINTVSFGVVEGTGMSDQGSVSLPNTTRVNLLQKYPLGMGKISDAVGEILFLLTDTTTWMTGCDIVVDGGNLSIDR